MRKSLLILCVLLLPYHALYAADVKQEYRKANKLFNEGKYAESIVVYRSVLSSFPHEISSGILYTRIADGYFQLGEYRNALDTYRAALKEQKGPERPMTQYWIGFCTFLLGKNAEAVNEFLKIPEHYPDSGMWVGTAYYWAGRACERMGDKDLAAVYFRKAGGSGKSTQGKFALKKAAAVKRK